MEGKRITAAEARALTGSVYMDRKETAEYLGISPRWLANNVRTGPPHAKVGALVLYRLSDVERWMKQQEVRRR